jgi:EAL domain-containing protein (putative c-di-GMP-specific phosphodiesterase class I)
MDTVSPAGPLDPLATQGGELAQRIAAGRVRVAYEPTICLALGLTHGAAARARWHDGGPAAHGVLGVAEETGLSAALTTAVFHRVAKEVGQAGTSVRVLVDLPGSLLRDADLPSRVAETLDLHGVPRGAIGFTVEMAHAMWDVHATTTLFDALRDLGCPLGLAGLGRTLSPVAHLDRLRPDRVSIDPTLVARMLEHPEGLTEMTGVLRLADRLGVVAMATAVETRGQAEWLKELGCTLAQGPLYGGPRDWLMIPNRHPCG